MNYVTCSSIAKRLGKTPNHTARDMRVMLGIEPVKMLAPDSSGPCARKAWCVTEEQAQKFIDHHSSAKAASLSGDISIPGRHEAQQQRIRESEGWSVIPAYKAGTPDLICIRKNSSGALEIMLEEVKGPGDAIRQSQYVFAQTMEKIGVKVVFTWLRD